MSSDSAVDPQRVTVVGGALTGATMAIYLARRDYDVELYEMRPDIRQADVTEGRSINLALSTRGLHALEAIGLADAARELCIPMHGRMIHSPEGELSFQPYGQEGQHINSVSRSALTALLVDAADEADNIELAFRQKCTDVDIDRPAVTFEDLEEGGESVVESDLVVGADGAYSAVRESLSQTEGFREDQSYLDHGYKELRIPPADDGGWRFDRHALHIWPRHDFMFIALPNPDGSFTGTLFLPYEGEMSFEEFEASGRIRSFFERQFPDLVDHLPDLEEQFEENPTSSLVTIRCEPFHHDGSVVLAGDAAHAVVPFYGQGMNASFEDCFVFDDLLEKFDDDFDRALPAFSQRRKPDADAIAELALYNYVEMRSKVADKNFLLRKRVERALEKAFPQAWQPLYSMVTFSNMPYAEAKDRAEQQEKVMDALLPESVLDAIGRVLNS
jgi:kynurenine 3-monooxygenase